MRYSEREIRDLLTPKDTPAPPAGLAERIKSEIPSHLETAPTSAAVVPFPRRFRQRTLLLAASFLVTIGGAFLAHRVLQESRSLEPLAVREGQSYRLAADSDEPSRGLPESAAESAEAKTAPAEQARAEQVPPATVQAVPAPAQPAAGAARDEPAAVGYLSDKKATAGPSGEKAGRAAAAPAEDAAPELPSVTVTSKVPSVTFKESVENDSATALANERHVRYDSLEADRLAKEAAAALEEQRRRRQESLAPESPELRRVAREPEAGAKRSSRNERLKIAAEPADAEATALPSREVAESFRPPAPPPRRNPNDAPYDDVYFRDYGTNPFIDTEDDALSTFGLDVDTASYAVMRRFLTDGHLPEPDAIRPEELINYFDYGDAPPRRGDFAIYAEGAPSPFAEGDRYYLLRFHLRARELDARERRPAHLTFVVDTSGSMSRENRLGLVKEALGLLVDHLRKDDRVAIVAYGSRAYVVLDATADRARVRSALSQLTAGGSTNAEEGLRLGYEIADREREKGTVNRVILCSDGVANVGSTSADAILERVGAYAGRGVELTTVGFGMGNFNDVLLEQLADRGNGRYAYVDTLDEARRIFVENLTGTLQTIAAEARVQVEFNPETVSRYRLVGYENRDIADTRFRDDTVDAGEIGAGHAVTALYEIKLREDRARRDEIATLRLRYGSVIGGKMVETERKVTGEDFAETWETSSRALRLTSLVAEFGEILKGSYWARNGDLDKVFRMAQAVAVEYPGDADVAEFVSLAGKAARYRR